ncbi:uncharacterized protein PG998_003409 [Apiospora kogelbergensis]|uniref:Uncharacterized protein n=1 Tax=Apiospora kogelbergensis TaxID=1337665 RepID=A0AAW0QPU7_9PEZI
MATMGFLVAVIITLFTSFLGNTLPGGLAMALPTSPSSSRPPTPRDSAGNGWFTIYYGEETNDNNNLRYSFVPDGALGDVCNQIMYHPILSVKDDVSGDKYGVRISGGSRVQPDVLEWSSLETGHWTMGVFPLEKPSTKIEGGACIPSG